MPWSTTRCQWIPLCVAQHARIITGRKAVVGQQVYVGPCANLIGWVWSLLGRETVQA